MRSLETLPCQSQHLEIHQLEVPSCCPVSKNPRPGSMVMICYRPAGFVVDVLTFPAYIRGFQGGLKDEQGNLLIRDMEAMIARLALDCANVVGVAVSVWAKLVIAPKQDMYLLVRRKPGKTGGR